MNGSELRFGRIENRLNLCLLIRSQVQLLGYSLKAERVSVPTAGPGCACTTAKPPSAIAPAATNANMFLFIVCFILSSRNILSLLQVMTDRQSGRVTIFLLFIRCDGVFLRQALGTSASTSKIVTKARPVAVIATGVDALSITWMILTQVRLFMLRSSMTMRRLAHWCDNSIRSWPKSSALIARIERMKKTFAK